MCNVTKVLGVTCQPHRYELLHTHFCHTLDMWLVYGYIFVNLFSLKLPYIIMIELNVALFPQNFTDFNQNLKKIHHTNTIILLKWQFYFAKLWQRKLRSKNYNKGWANKQLILWGLASGVSLLKKNMFCRVVSHFIIIK